MRKAIGLASGLAALGGAAAAQDIGMPRPAQVGFQPAATELARDLQAMDGLLLVIITAIVILVTGLLVYVVRNFSAEKNPTPARFTHNAPLEVAWTAIPVMILVAIAFPSLNLLYKQLEIPEPELTIKATGNQWYWSYEYPDFDIGFDALMVAAGYASFDAAMADPSARADIEAYGVTRETWLLATDMKVVVPVDTVVKVQVTGSDVIHAWTVPSFGVKVDAIPGRLNELWFKAERLGTYYGQCSELCGERHAYMPIAVEVVTREQFDAWMEEQRVAAGLEPQTIRLAAAE